MYMDGLQYKTNMGDELALERRVVIRSELNDLSTLLSKAGDECFIVTACVTDETPHLLGSIKGTDFVESKSLIVKTEFLQYLKNQVSSEVVRGPDVIDDPCSERKVVRSLMIHLAGRLHADGEECFIVSANNPNVLGSDKGKAYFCENFKFCQKAFSRHIDESNLYASTVGKKHVEMSRPNVSFAQYSRPTGGNRSSQSVVLVKDYQIKESPSLLLGKPVPNEFTPVKANVDQPVTPVSNDDDYYHYCSNSDDELMTDDELWAPDIKKHNENHGIRSDVSAGENKRATNTNGFEGTSDECKQGTNSYTLEIKSFTCVVKGCLREFIARWPLLKHYQSHTETKLITCRECDEQFKSSTTAIKHCRTAHPYNEKLQPQYPSRQQLEDLERQLIADNTDGRV
ncbi:uncharacterized protein LOC128211914 isoform X1 [Mya arenaria]|uniref:uncharacterized protein LOC128211914 isoform X1 n=2 Tax=Mya arenaria TaxID=6604 RepID=UPI0022E747C9|nr:uncharacterized protein LOC128211914 isoform X1 [Mya arenaria]